MQQVKSKYKICKRLGGGVFEKCQTQKFTLSESRRDRRKKTTRPRALSDFGKQLLEKQKLRYVYGIGEKQLARYIKQASAKRGANAGEALLEALESRLDNVVYRLGLAHTRRFARQIVSHGHITVNGRKITIPSFSVSKGDAIAVRGGSKNKTLFALRTDELKEHHTPTWLRFDTGKLEGIITQKPALSATEVIFDPSAVLEFYSR